MKNLPYSKTVVAELKVQLADLYTRTVLLKSSAAAAIPNDNPFNSGDAIVTRDVPLQITGIKNCVILSSFEDFDILFRSDAGDIETHCKGLFVHMGSIDNIWIRPPVAKPQIRMQYIWS